MPEKPPVTKALGLEMSSLSKDLRDKYKLKDDAKGVVVTDVENGSPADDKQVKPGDLILQVGQQVVDTPQDVDQAHRRAEKGGHQAGAAAPVQRLGRAALRRGGAELRWAAGFAGLPPSGGMKNWAAL